jgi:CrcB protein
MSFFAVGIGGFVGAVLRWLITKSLAFTAFPLGTLVSNAAAGLLIGFIIGMERQTSALSPNVKLFLTTGMLGGLSTFSTFSMETVSMLENGKLLSAGGNVLFNVGLSLLFVVLGLTAAKMTA